MRVDAATAEVLSAFAAAGIDSVLLKGPSIARWLYTDEEPRAYRDCDLLVSPAAIERAEDVLGRLGFVNRFEEDRLPEWWREHASEWWREQDGVMVDLHRTLADVGVDDESAWRALSSTTESMPVAGYPAPVLTLPARALHAALHAMHHGVDWHTPIADLERALEQVDETVWRNAADLAARLDALDAFAVGLRLTPAGQELADKLALPERSSVRTALLASSPPPVALGFDQLARAKGVRRRAAIVARKIVPPASFMRRWHWMASRGRTGLLLAYLYRPIWILRKAPAAFRAWRAARRESTRPS
jgi:hypothetical protein